MPKLIDIHNHLQFAAFRDDYKEAMRRALQRDIWMIISGTEKKTSAKAVEIALGEQEGVYATVGLHPIHTEAAVYDVQEFGNSPAGGQLMTKGEEFDDEFYRDLAKHPKVVGIGECGLDYYRLTEETKLKQKGAFISQIQLAYEVKKPLIIHCRDAYADLIDIISTHRSFLLDSPGVVHFFAGEREDADRLLDLGFYFSFGGVITFAEKYRDIIEYIPLNRILLETDAPYVAPTPYRGERNEPSYIVQVAKKIAEIKMLEVEEVEEITTNSSRLVFGV